MAIQLYRKGSTHTVRGVECEVRNVTLAEMYQLMETDQGWVKNEQDLVEPSVVEPPVVDKAKKKTGQAKKEPK